MGNIELKNQSNLSLEAVIAYHPVLSSLLDENVVKQIKSFSDFLIKNKIPFKAQELVNYVDEQMVEQVHYLGKMQYLLMEKTDDFTEAGEQRVAISFCRSLLNIPAHREVTQLDANLFREELSNFQEKLGNVSAESLKNRLKQACIEMFGQKVSITDYDLINQFLKLIGSKNTFSYAHKNSGFALMYGEQIPIPGVTQKFRSKVILLQKTELARTPALILSMVASSYPYGVVIRHASCETIFYNKWHSFFETSEFEKELLQSHDYSNIREAIKKRALEVYGYGNTEQVERGKEHFIDEMVEGVIWHELGHSISLDEDKFIETRLAKLNSTLSSFGNESVTVLKEALADWAPSVDGVCGPIWHFIQLAKKDYVKAKRMVYVYLSDYWFLDVGEDFMGITTDIIVGVLLPFIDEHGEIDFKKMEEQHQSIFNYFIKSYRAAGELLLKVYENSKFQISEQQTINFDVIRKQLLEIYRDDPELSSTTVKALEDTSSFWMNMQGYLKKFAPSDHKKLLKTISEFSKKFCEDLLRKISGGKSAQYNNSLRTFVVESMKQKGFYVIDRPQNPRDWVEAAITELKLPEEAAKAARHKFEAISEGREKVEVAIDYESKPSPFIAVLQDILVRSDMGQLLSGMAIGENLSSSQKTSKNELQQYFANISKHLNDNDFNEIALLKVNENLIESVEDFNRLFNGAVLKDGSLLKDKIRKVSVAAMEQSHLMELFVPLKKGRWDWNTVQAVWRINTDIRPDQEDKQWVVDQEFLQKVFEEIS